MNAPKAATQLSTRLAAGALALVVLAVLGWLVFGREEPRARQAAEPAAVPDEPEPRSAVPATVAGRPTTEPTATPVANVAPSAEALPPSHPLTPAHERIYRENHLIGQLQGAVDVEDAAGIRRLLKQYREEYPEDEHWLQGGYERIADCLDHPGEASRAEAQRWFDTYKASTARRALKRICLDR